MDSLLTKKEKFTRQRIIWKFSGKRVLCLDSRLCTIYMYIVHSLWSCQILIWYKWNRPGCYNTIIEYLEWVIIPRLKLTRMHSSRMCTACTYLVQGGVCSRGVPGPGELSAPEGCLLQGVVCSREGCTWSRGVSAPGVVHLVPGGCLSAPGGCLLQGRCTWSRGVSAPGECLLVRYPPCEQNEWQTRVKT